MLLDAALCAILLDPYKHRGPLGTVNHELFGLTVCQISAQSVCQDWFTIHTCSRTDLLSSTGAPMLLVSRLQQIDHHFHKQPGMEVSLTKWC